MLKIIKSLKKEMNIKITDSSFHMKLKDERVKFNLNLTLRFEFNFDQFSFSVLHKNSETICVFKSTKWLESIFDCQDSALSYATANGARIFIRNGCFYIQHLNFECALSQKETEIFIDWFKTYKDKNDKLLFEHIVDGRTIIHRYFAKIEEAVNSLKDLLKNLQKVELFKTEVEKHSLNMQLLIAEQEEKIHLQHFALDIVNNGECAMNNYSWSLKKKKFEGSLPDWLVELFDNFYHGHDLDVAEKDFLQYQKSYNILVHKKERTTDDETQMIDLCDRMFAIVDEHEEIRKFMSLRDSEFGYADRLIMMQKSFKNERR